MTDTTDDRPLHRGPKMRRIWKMASKTGLGDTYHLAYAGGNAAACSWQIVLMDTYAKKSPLAEGPAGVRCCQRCQKIAAHWNAAAAERV